MAILAARLSDVWPVLPRCLYIWLAIFLRANAVPIEYRPVSNTFSAGTESQVLNAVSESVIGSFSQLKVGSTYIANRINVASNIVRTYFFYKPTLQAPFSQGNITDSGVRGLNKLLMLESKLMIGITGVEVQQSRNFTMAYDVVSERYTRVSMMVDYFDGFSPFYGLTCDPSHPRAAYWLGNANILYKWSADSGFGASCQVLHSVALQMQPYGRAMFVYGDTNTAMQFVDPTTMTVAKELGGDLLGSYFRFDSNRKNMIFVMDNTISTLAAVDFDKLSNYEITIDRLFTAPSRGILLDFGVFPFLAMVDGDNTMVLMNKENIQQVDASLFQPMLPFIGYLRGSMAQGTDRAFEYPVFHLVRGSNCVNAHLYYFRFDICFRNESGKCGSCPSNYYLSEFMDTCLPIAKGLSLTTLASCSVPNCAECANTAAVCTRCASVPILLFIFNNTCIPSTVSRFGPSGSYLVPCLDSHCIDCSTDSSTCSECDATTGWIQSEGKCIRMADLQSRKQGVNKITFEVEPCIDAQCLSCVEDITKCTSCDTTNGYVLSSENQVCTDQLIGSKSPRILTSFSEADRTVKLEFMGPIDNNVKNSYFDISLTDIVEFRTPVNCSQNGKNMTIQLKEIGNRVLTFFISTERQIIDGSLTISLSSTNNMLTSSGNPVLGFPVVQDGIQILIMNTTTVGQIGEVSGAILNNAKLALTVLLAATQTKSLGSPNYIFSQQSLLALLEGPWVNLPDQILYNSIQYIQGVPPLPNPFVAIHGEDETCDLPPRYARLEMKCSYTLNFGAPLLAIAIVIFLSMFVEWLHRNLSQQMKKTNSILGQSAEKTKIGHSANSTKTATTAGTESSPVKSKGFNFSAQLRTNLRKSATKLWWIQALKPFRSSFAVDYVESLLAEILLYSFLNLTKQPSDSPLKLGTTLSLLSFAGVSLMLFVGLRGALSIKRKCQQETTQSGRTVDKVVDLETAEWAPFVKKYEDVLAPLSMAQVLQPFAEYLRCFLSAFVVIGVSFQPLGQVCCMIAIQTLYIVNFVVFYRKKSQLDKWVTLWIESQFLAYMVLKLLVLLDTDTNRTQNLTGLIMAVLLVSLQLTAIVLQSYGLLLGLYQLIRSRSQKSIDKANQSLILAEESERVEISPDKTLLDSAAGRSLKIISGESPKQGPGDGVPATDPKKEDEDNNLVVLANSGPLVCTAELKAKTPAAPPNKQATNVLPSLSVADALSSGVQPDQKKSKPSAGFLSANDNTAKDA